MKFRSDETVQGQLLPYSFRDLVPNDSDIWLYIDLFASLNLGPFERSYSGEGETPLDPRLMLRVIFYGLTHGTFTGRKLMNACRYDNRYIILSGDQRPDRRTFDRFIRRHKDNFSSLFKTIVKLAKEMGLVNLGQISIDGTRLKGHTNSHKFVKYGKIEKILGHLEANLSELRNSLGSEGTDDEKREQLSEEIKNKERRQERILQAKKKIEEEYQHRDDKSRPIENCTKSLNDLDAQPLSHKSEGQGFMYGYNAQIAVAGEGQVVVEAELHDKASDYQALPTLLDKIEEDYQEKPTQVLVDRGYNSFANLEELEKRNIEAFVGILGPKEKELEVQEVEQLTPGEDKHHYHCLSGKQIPIDGRRKDGRTSLIFSEDFCRDCPHQINCKLHIKKTFSVPARENFLRQKDLYQRSRTEGYKEIYARRKVCVEPVFGNIKYNKLFHLYVIGRQYVCTRFSMACIAHNIEKILNKKIFFEPFEYFWTKIVNFSCA